MKSTSRNFLLSLPERGLRSLTALASGALRELSEVSLPQTVRRSRLYQNLVDATLRFLIEEVGDVQGVYSADENVAGDFLLRRAAGNGVEWIGILAFRASPVWVLAALADVSGAGRHVIREIATALQEDGLLEPTTSFSTVDEMLDGLEASAGRLAATINTPPLDVATLRQEWTALRRDLSRIPPKQLPRMTVIADLWQEIRQTARKEDRTVFQVSSLLAMSAINSVPERARWLSASVRSAARKTGTTVATVLLNDYRTTLKDIRRIGYLRYAVRQLQPYVSAAISHFSPQRSSLTERMLTASSRRRKKAA